MRSESDDEREERTSESGRLMTESDGVGGGGEGETEPERLAARRRRRNLGSENVDTVRGAGDGVEPVQP